MQPEPNDLMSTDRLAELGEVAAVLLGIDIRSCADRNLNRLCDAMYRRICEAAGRFNEACEKVTTRLGGGIRQRHLAVSGLDLFSEGFSPEDFRNIAKTMDGACAQVRADWIGGFAADLRHGPESLGSFLGGLPDALAATERVCGSLLVGHTRSGLNWNSLHTALQHLRAASLANPLYGARMGIAAGFHGWSSRPYAVQAPIGGPDRMVFVRPAPAVVLASIPTLTDDGPALPEVAGRIRTAAYRAIRSAEYVGRAVAEELGAAFGGVEPILQPSRRIENSIATALQRLGLEQFGAAGTLSVLRWFQQQWTIGAKMACPQLAGEPCVVLSTGQDLGIHAALQSGKLNSDRLLFLSAAGAAQLDQLVVPARVEPEAVTAYVADVLGAALAQGHSTNLRVIVAPHVQPGEVVSLGLLGGESIALALPGADLSSRFVRSMQH